MFLAVCGAHFNQVLGIINSLQMEYNTLEGQEELIVFTVEAQPTISVCQMCVSVCCFTQFSHT